MNNSCYVAVINLSAFRIVLDIALKAVANSILFPLGIYHSSLPSPSLSPSPSSPSLSPSLPLPPSPDPKTLPHVSAGPDVTITLPQNTAVLNGSATWDDFGITSYQWSRSNRSPAAGVGYITVMWQSHEKHMSHVTITWEAHESCDSHMRSTWVMWQSHEKHMISVMLRVYCVHFGNENSDNFTNYVKLLITAVECKKCQKEWLIEPFVQL